LERVTFRTSRSCQRRPNLINLFQAPIKTLKVKVKKRRIKITWPIWTVMIVILTVKKTKINKKQLPRGDSLFNQRTQLSPVEANHSLRKGNFPPIKSRSLKPTTTINLWNWFYPKNKRKHFLKRTSEYLTKIRNHQKRCNYYNQR